MKSHAEGSELKGRSFQGVLLGYGEEGLARGLRLLGWELPKSEVQQCPVPHRQKGTFERVDHCSSQGDAMATERYFQYFIYYFHRDFLCPFLARKRKVRKTSEARPFTYYNTLRGKKRYR